MTLDTVETGHDGANTDLLADARRQGAAWLQEELAGRPNDPEAAIAGVADRLMASPDLMRTLALNFGRMLLTERHGVLSAAEREQKATTLLAELDRIREQVSRGRVFPSSADVIREMREEESDWPDVSGDTSP